MKCPRCHKELGEKEYICKNCLTIIDLQKYEEEVDEKVKEIGVEQNKPKNKHFFCEKCGGYVKIGGSVCHRCGHIINEELYEVSAQAYREKAEEENIISSHKALGFWCYMLPLLGLIMWIKYRKKNPVLAKHCKDQWFYGIGKIRLLFVLVLLALIGFLIGGF